VDRRWVVLLHELSHAKRLDCAARLVGQLACAVYWFNPLAWLALTWLQAESERACDDLVLRAGTKALSAHGQFDRGSHEHAEPS
jgi:beta-lactamase regulating signal transducer with metallopeptidase domain